MLSEGPLYPGLNLRFENRGVVLRPPFEGGSLSWFWQNVTYLIFLSYLGDVLEPNELLFLGLASTL